MIYLVVSVSLLPDFELSSPREPEEPLLLQLRVLTPLFVLLELSFRLSSRALHKQHDQKDTNKLTITK
jgi:hypothetical protein